MTYIQNKYTTYYYSIINAVRSRISNIDNITYLEKHHIIPECFYKTRKRKGLPGWVDGDSNDATNLIYLTAREHFICHLLLTKMVDGKARSKMHLALLSMSRTSSNRTRYKITSRSYDKIRKDVSVAFSGSNNPMWGKIRTVEEKLKISEGIAKSDFVRPKMSQSTKDKIAESKKNKPRPQSVIDAMVAGRKNVTFDNNSGKHWYNNGLKDFLSKEMPPGCKPGRLIY